MEAVLETLSNKTQTIILIYKVCLEDMMEKELEIKLKEKDVEMKSKQNELILQLKEKDMEMKSNEKDLTRKLDKLKDECARQNWKHLKLKAKLDIRSVLELFEKDCLDKKPYQRMKRLEKYKHFANEVDVINKVTSSDFSPETFADTVVMLFENLNKTAHPPFRSGDTLMVQDDYLSQSEWRVLSLLWKLCPLPEGNLQKIKTACVTT